MTDSTSQLQKQLSVIQDLTVNSGIFIWKVTGVSKRLASTKLDEIIDSPPFFTHERGYKLQLQLYPNGHRKGKGTHLSLYIRVCKGPNDDSLTWPFHARLTFKVLDLTGNRAHETNLIEAGEIGPDFWKRPSDGPNSGIGQSKFLAHVDVNKKGSCFVSDNTLYIGVYLGK